MFRQQRSPESDSDDGDFKNDPHELYLGDIYSRLGDPAGYAVEDSEMRKDLIGPYQQHVRNVFRGWHHLRYLADFMAISTLPLRYKELSSESRQERLKRVSISVVECGDELSARDLRTPQELSHFLKGLRSIEEAQKSRLLIVQDLSTTMIEELGAAFDIEPGFFRTHIGDYVWLNTRDPQAEIPDLEAFSRTSNYFSVQFASPRYFENQEQLREAMAETENFNVSRRIDHDGVFKGWSDVAGSDVGLVRSKVSLWVRPKRDPAQAWLGILLVDPTVTSGFPLWAGYGSLHPPPSMHTPLSDISVPSRGTNVQRFIYWTLNQACSKPLVPPPSPDLLPIAIFTMVCTEWILMCEYINTRLTQIEWEIELGLPDLFDAQDFDSTLKTLLLWRRRLPIYHSFIERSISRIETRHKNPVCAAPFESWSSIIVNLRDVLKRLEILHCRADKIMAVSMAVTARGESKKATHESHAITRVSYLAFIFVPLSFLASFFSMGETLAIRTWWIFALTAVPISACAVSVLVFAGSIGRLWRWIWDGRWAVRRERGRRRKAMSEAAV